MTLSHAEALLELNDRAETHQFIAAVWGPTGRPLMSSIGELTHWTAERRPGALLHPPDDMAGLYRVGGARVDVSESEIERVERLHDGLQFHAKGGGSIALRWVGA